MNEELLACIDVLIQIRLACSSPNYPLLCVVNVWRQACQKRAAWQAFQVGQWPASTWHSSDCPSFKAPSSDDDVSVYLISCNLSLDMHASHNDDDDLPLPSVLLIWRFPWCSNCCCWILKSWPYHCCSLVVVVFFIYFLFCSVVGRRESW